MLVPLISRFLRAFPAIELELVVDDALVDMVSSGFDAGVRFGESVAADMIAVAIGPRHRFAVVGSPDHFEHNPRPLSPHDLKTHPCIRYRFASGSFYRWEFERKGRKVSVEVHGALTLDAPSLIREATLEGVGLAYLVDWRIAADVEAGRVVRVLEDWMPSSSGLSLYYPGHRYVPAGLRAFVGVVREATRAPPI